MRRFVQSNKSCIQRFIRVLACRLPLFLCLIPCFAFDVAGTDSGSRTATQHSGGKLGLRLTAEGLSLRLRGGSHAWPSPRREGSRPRYDRSPIRSEELDEEEDFVDYVEKSTVELRKEKEREHLVEQFGGGLDSCLKKHESVLERRIRLSREARARRQEEEDMMLKQEKEENLLNTQEHDGQLQRQHDSDVYAGTVPTQSEQGDVERRAEHEDEGTVKSKRKGSKKSGRKGQSRQEQAFEAGDENIGSV